MYVEDRMIRIGAHGPERQGTWAPGPATPTVWRDIGSARPMNITQVEIAILTIADSMILSAAQALKEN